MSSDAQRQGWSAFSRKAPFHAQGHTNAAMPVKPHSNVALSALEKLEARHSIASVSNVQLEPPPRPVARRKQPFLVPPSLPRPPPRAVQPKIVLDGFVLLETCRVEDPEQAQKAVLEGCGISAVVADDLPFFAQLTHLDLGDNHVRIEALAYLPALFELHLDCNGLTTVDVPPGGFPALEVLNLSFNGLSAAVGAQAVLGPRRAQRRHHRRLRLPEGLGERLQEGGGTPL